ncbi:CLUMA_CG001303, isoform A [Clunio marinus]|uniref:Odorant receptor n=1 Tax=Clunio marinus TaxID=568069 RepID=A0A1J1HM28_9DIPT|nr:CLUMA_CG001303, isoform A [Clunio marinus]
MSTQRDALEIFFKVFNYYGLSAFKKREKKSFLFFLLFVFAVPGNTIILLLATAQATTIDEKVRNFRLVPLYVAALVKGVNLVANLKDILDLIASMKEMMKEIDDQEIVKRANVQSMRILIMYLVTGFSPLIATQIFSLITQEQVIQLPSLPTGYESFQICVFAIYWILYNFGANYSTLLSLLLSFILSYFLTCFQAYSEFLCGEDQPSKKTIQNFYKLKRTAKKYSEIFSTVILYQVCLAMLTLASHAFAIADLKNIFSVESIPIFLMTIIIILVSIVPCYIGNEVQLNTGKIIDKFFETNWYELQPKQRKNMIVMQSILQERPIQLKVAGIFIINLDSFFILINSTYAIFAFMKNFKN